MTEAEINYRLKGGIATTDITELLLCLEAWLIDLSEELQRLGKYKQLVKKNVELTYKITNRLVINITNILKRHNVKYERAWTETYDMLIEAIDNAVLLKGYERHYSLVMTAIQVMEAKMQELQSIGYRFDGIQLFMDIYKLDKLLTNALGDDYYDLSAIFRQQLKMQIEDDEIAIAKEDLRKQSKEEEIAKERTMKITARHQGKVSILPMEKLIKRFQIIGDMQ